MNTFFQTINENYLCLNIIIYLLIENYRLYFKIKKKKCSAFMKFHENLNNSLN